jgi:hypothetical protein
MTAQIALEMFVLFCVCICVVAMAVIGGHAYGKYVMKEPETPPDASEHLLDYSYAQPMMKEAQDSAEAVHPMFKPQCELIRSDKR